LLLPLCFGFVADHPLKLRHEHRVGVRARRRADAVVRRPNVRDPIAQGFVHRVLERPRTRFDGDDAGAEHVHAEHVRRLPFDVDRAHVHFAGQAHHGRGRGGRNAVLSGARLGDDAGLAELFCEKDLAERVIYLVRAGVAEIFPLEPHFADRRALGVERFRQAIGAIKGGRASDVVTEQAFPLVLKRLGDDDGRHGPFELGERGHESLGHEPAAVFSEVAGAGRLCRLRHGRATILPCDRCRRPTEGRLPRRRPHARRWRGEFTRGRVNGLDCSTSLIRGGGACGPCRSTQLSAGVL
jgi:hypothetical protein